MSIFRDIKWFIQRGKRGYANCDYWNFFDYLTDIIIAGLKDLKQHQFGCSSELYDKNRKDNECWKWEELLQEMIDGFEASKILNRPYFWKETKGGQTLEKIDWKKNKLLTKKFQRGMELFSKYYLNLWD